MTDVYSHIRGELEALVSNACPEAGHCPIDLDCAVAEASAPLGLRPNANAAQCAAALEAAVQSEPPQLFGAPLIQSIFINQGHVCFSFTAAAYSAAIAHIIKSYPTPAMPEDTSTEPLYAAARMLMLARGEGRGCPDIAPVKRALWLALGVEGNCKKKREAMRKRAAKALLCMMDGMSAAERDALRPELGEVGACAARLLCIQPQ